MAVVQPHLDAQRLDCSSLMFIAVGANMGGALYLLLRDEDPQGRVADHTSLMSLENN